MGRTKGKDTYFVIKGVTYSDVPSYYEWDKAKEFPRYEETGQFEWIPDGISSIEEGVQWLLENYPECYMGGGVYERYVDNYDGKREPLDFCALAVPSYYEAIFHTSDRGAILNMIRESRENKKQEVDLSLYKEQGFDYSQMKEIRLGLEQGLDVSIYTNPEYNCYQMHEIRLGLIEDLDVSIYANPEYESPQMTEIRFGLEQGLDVSLYANLKYNWLQMKEIRFGLEEKLDVSAYADPEYGWCQMAQIRLRLEEEKETENSVEDKEM